MYTYFLNNLYIWQNDKFLITIFKYTFKKIGIGMKKKNERDRIPNDITSKIGFVPFVIGSAILVMDSIQEGQPKIT